VAAPARQSESNHLQSIIDSIPSLIHTARPDGYLDYFNQHWLEYLGLPLEYVLGWKWTGVIHPEDVEAIVNRWRSSVATGEPFLLETRVRRADGKYRWMLHHKVAVRGEGGQIVKWYGSSIDIEDRKRAEEARQRTEFFLAEGQRLSHTGSWAFNPAGFDYWSSELFEIYGLDASGKAPTVEEYLALVHPEDRESVVREIEKMLAHRCGFDFTKRIVRPDGKIRRVRCVGVPTAHEGTLQGFVGTGIDVTEQEELTQELQRREAYLAEAQRLSRTGSFGWKVASGEILWSEETFRIFEIDRTATPTVDLVLQRVHPEDAALAKQIIERASRDGKDFDFEHRLLMPDSSVKHVRVVAHALGVESESVEFVGAVMDITDAKQVEDRIRRIIDAVPGLHWSARPDGWVDFINQRWLDYTGMTLEQALGWGWTPAYHPDEIEQVQVEWRTAVAEGKPLEMETRLRRFDGEYRWFLERVSPLFDRTGRILGWYGSDIDIHDRKQAEKKLQQSEAYLAEAQRLSQTGSWAWSPDQDIRYWSEECYRILGFDPRDGLPRIEELIQRIHPDDQPAFSESAKKAKHNKIDEEVDYRIVHPGGAVRDIHSIGHPVVSPCGDLIEYTGTVIDVTERKRAEEELRRSEMELRQMLDLSPQQVAVFGPGGERLYANRVGLDYIGLSLEEWRHPSGNFPGGLIHPDDRERAARAYTDGTRSSGSAYESELRVRKADGSYRWFLARYNPLRDDKGQITRWYVALTDIEDRKRAEEKLQHENVALREEIDKASMFEEIVGTSKPLKDVLSRIAKVAPTDSTVLIVGETGTGKELIARAVHKRSQRCGGAFVSVNCAAIPRDLIASELFGHEKGAFTGAIQRRLGRFELADGGTIFLDEVGELLPDTQVALLRVLQEREFERVGGGHPIHVDVRIIAATNRDLRATVAGGIFRQDLFYRLNVFPIEVPPLRERKDDILMLVEYFVQRYAIKAGKHIRSIDKKTLELLQSYDWPGNIRELQNVIERSVILSPGDVFSVDELWLSKQTPRPASRVKESALLNGEVEQRSEREIIEAALAETRGRVSGPAGAAARLGIPPSTLDHRIKALRIHKEQFKFR